jgi:hypothetical protein
LAEASARESELKAGAFELQVAQHAVPRDISVRPVAEDRNQIVDVRALLEAK